MSSPDSSPEGATEFEIDEDAGVRVEMAVDRPQCCPVADVSADCGVTVDSVAKTSHAAPDRSVIEFTMPAAAQPSRRDVTEVYTSGDRSRYRCEHRSTGTCLCEFVERRASPVSHQHVVAGTVHVTFYVADLATVRGLVDAARETFGTVRLERLSQSAPLNDEQPVVVDRACLTDRQREVLTVAYEMGYFAYPKRANACDVADALGIATSTFSEHLGAAQSKLLAAVLDDS